MKKLLIMGSGQMGCGIAQVAAISNYLATLKDPSVDQLGKAKKSIENALDKLVAKEKMTIEKRDATLKNIAYTTDISNQQFDILIEAVPENKELKVAVIKDMLSYSHANSLIATNTSSLSITELALLTDLKQRLVGIHFMNPVPIMPLVELIKGINTNPENIFEAKEFVKSINKTPIESADRPAFIVNRILIPMINEAIFALYEGVGTVEDIDNAMTLGANQPMGPLRLADFIGLDTCLSIMNVLYDGFKDSKYRPCPLLVSYVQGGKLGKKVGIGFYHYDS